LLVVVTGILVQTTFNFSLPIIIGGCGAVIALCFWKIWFLYVLVALLSAMNTSLHLSPEISCRGRDLTFSGTVIAEEHRANYVKLSLTINKAFVNDRIIDYYVPCEFYTRERGTFLGKKLLIKGRIKNSKYQSRPHILTGNIIKQNCQKDIFGGLFYTMRSHIDTLINNLLNKEHRDLALGLILGGSGRIRGDLKEIFSRAGVIHILAVSGLHVGFVCTFVGIILLFVPISLRLKFIITILVLCLYAGITGFRPSVCRATLMAFLFGLALILQRNVDSLHITNITAMIFLLIHPLVIFDVGAQLSFAAVYGIVLVYPVINAQIIKRIKGRIYKPIITAMAVSFSAQVFVSPLLIYYFHRLPTLAVISNLIIVPVASVTIFLLLLCLIVGTFSFLCAQLIASFISLLLNTLIIVSKFFAYLPFSTITVYVSPIILILLYFIYARRFRKGAVFCILVILIFFSAASYANCVIIRHAPVGTLISTPHGENIFITSKCAPTKTATYLASQNADKLNYLIAPDDYYVPEKQFFSTPEGLTIKRFTIGDMIVDVAEQVRIIFHSTKINVEDYDFNPSEEVIWHIITNGKKTVRFTTPLYGSIVDQLIVDARTVLAKLILL
jgi:ComEC/Rec2-related protein